MTLIGELWLIAAAVIHLPVTGLQVQSPLNDYIVILMSPQPSVGDGTKADVAIT